MAGQVYVDIDDLLAAQPQGQETISVDDLVDEVLAEAQESQRPLNVEQGQPSDLPAFTEAGAAFKLGQRGVYDRLRKLMPDRAVVPQKDDEGNIGSILVAEPGQEGVPINEQKFRRFNVGTLAKTIPTAIKFASGVAGSMLGASGGPVGAIGGGAAGDAFGNAVVQGLDELLFTGDSKATPGERLADMGIDVGLGVAVPVAVGSATRGAKRLAEGVGVETREKALREANEMAARGGQEAAERTARAQAEGVDLTIGQATRSQDNLVREAGLAQSEGSREILDQASKRQVEQVRTAVENLTRRLGVDDSAEAGVRVANAVQAGRSQLRRVQAENFEQAMNAVQLATRGRPIIPQTNTLQTARELLGEFEGVSPIARGGDEVGRVLKRVRNSLDSLDGPISAGRLQNEMASLGRILRSIEKNPDKAYERRVLTRLLEARRADLEDAENIGHSVAANTLQRARANYAAIQREIEDMSQPVLDKAMKLVDDSSPEKVVERIMGRGTTRTGNAKIAEVLHKADPQALSDLQATVVGEMMRKATGAQGFSPASFRTAFFSGGNKAKLKALFRYDRKGFEALEQIAKIADDVSPQVGTRSAANPSGTAGVVIEWMKRRAGGAGQAFRSFLLELPVIRNLASPERANQFLAELVTDPVKRTQLETALKAARKNPRRWGGLVADALAKFAATGGEHVAAEQEVMDFEGVAPPVELEVQPPTIPLDELQDYRAPDADRRKPTPSPQPQEERRSTTFLERLLQ